MRRIVFVGALVLAGCATRSTPIWQTRAGEELRATRGETWRWSFDEPSPATFTGTLPFEAPRRLFYEVLGRWSATAATDARSAPNVFRQSAPMLEGDAPRVVVGSLAFADFVAAVSCRARSGVHDRGCGLIVRAQDADDYDLARWDDVRGVLELVRVVDGREEVLASAPAPGDATNGWHVLTVSAHLRVVQLSFDGVIHLDARDTTFAEGKIGLWTRGDAVTDFDDLEVVAE